MSDPKIYTVGWICALSTESVAAQAFLDEKHPSPEYLPANDNNTYKLGRIGQHNVVIAVLPNGEYGVSSAAGVARDMLRSFPNIRIGLLVGIGGGAPSAKHDIRLGDVVVGIANDGDPAVTQYDFVKAVQGEQLKEIGYLNQAPTLLRTAVNSLKADYELEGNQIQNAIDKVLVERPRLRRNYLRPEASSDRLYRSSVVHSARDEADCSIVCGNDLIVRRKRGEDDDDPTVHYGLIASANILMKDALVRDELIAAKDVLCIEMEAAGLMNQFPCLVIRGICDYSDSHKNKLWQGYAAMAAAAYAKDLLQQIASSRIEGERKISEAVFGLYNVIEEQRDLAKEQLQVHKDLKEERLSDKEKKCHQLFRLTSDSKDATYEWYKDRVEERAENTCLWVLKHDHFRKWMKQESGPLLVTADPGCGKSVLAKYLIDHELPQSATICYFFFKDQDQNTSRQALCALLHQLFAQKPSLIRHAMPQFDLNGKKLSESTASLWTILRNATKDPEAGPVIVVLDALDECAESESEDLIRNLKGQFPHGYLNGKLKYLLTCRPYEQITTQFHSLISSFPDICIPGEEESETISQEISYVITQRINRLSALKNLTIDIKDHLTKRLQEITHRTYLWVYLIFNHLEEISFKKTQRGIELIIATLPGSVNEAYERILNKSKDREAVKKTLSIILAASRPLNLREMNAAINLVGTSHGTYDLDLEDTESFRLRIRSLCGLFIAIHHDKVYFLHQTAREFLTETTSLAVDLPPLSWQRSISLRRAHTTLASLCVTYLDLFNSNDEFSKDIQEIRVHNGNSLDFLDYAAANWHEHARKGNIDDNVTILPLLLQICDPSSKSHQLWFRIFERSVYWTKPTRDASSLVLASYFGLTAVAKLCLKKGSDIETTDRDDWTPLFWAVSSGHKEVVKVLLEKGANIDAADTTGQTPLWWAAFKGHEEIVKMLLEKGANIDAADKDGETPLWRAASNGHEEIVKMLLEKGANITAMDSKGRTPLQMAASRGNEGVVKILRQREAELKAYHEHNP